MKACGGNRDKPPLFLNLGIRGRWVVNLTAQPPFPRERTPIPLNQTQSQSGWFGEEKISCPSRDFNPDCTTNRCTSSFRVTYEFGFWSCDVQWNWLKSESTLVPFVHDTSSVMSGKVKLSRNKSRRLRRGDVMLGFHPYFDIRHN
jgi:hypothetical protein